MNNQPASSVSKSATWTNHLEHRLVADLWLNRHLSPDERVLSLMVTSFSYRSLVGAHRARLQSHLGWDDARYDGVKCSLLLDGWMWTWEGSQSARTHDEGWWAWRDGRAQVDATLARAEMRFPDEWSLNPERMADRNHLYAQRVGLKRAARLFKHDDSESRLTLAVLATGLDHTAREASTVLTPWMREALTGVNIRSSVRKLERWGFIEVSGDRTQVRYTEGYASELSRYESHWGGRGRTNRETDFELAWTQALNRPEWRGAERKARGNRWYLYTLETTADLSIEVDGVREDFPAGSTVYIGITTVPEMRSLEHWDASETGSNPRLEALKAAAEAVNRDAPPICQVVIEDHDAESMTWVEAQQRERHLVQAYAAQGHPLLNIQYLMPGKDWVKGGDHNAVR